MEGCDKSVFLGVENRPTTALAVKSEKERCSTNNLVESSLRFWLWEEWGAHGMVSKRKTVCDAVVIAGVVAS